MTTITISPEAESYGASHVDDWLREIAYVRTLAYPHHERDVMALALARAFEDGKADELENGDCGHDDHLGADVSYFVSMLHRRFSDDELGPSILMLAEQLAGRH